MMAKKWFKSDWTVAHLFYYLSVIGYVLAGIVILILLIGMIAGAPVSASVQVEVENLKQFEQLEKLGISMSNKVSGDIMVSQMKQLPILAVIFFYLWEIWPYVISFIISFLFSKILKAVINEKPFHEKNSSHFFTIGWVLIFSRVAIVLFIFYITSVFGDLNLPAVTDISWASGFGANYFYFGVFMLVLGSIFKVGTRLTEEQKLTV